MFIEEKVLHNSCSSIPSLKQGTFRSGAPLCFLASSEPLVLVFISYLISSLFVADFKGYIKKTSNFILDFLYHRWLVTWARFCFAPWMLETKTAFAERLADQTSLSILLVSYFIYKIYEG